jgi:hypothetical protein
MDLCLRQVLVLDAGPVVLDDCGEEAAQLVRAFAASTTTDG